MHPEDDEALDSLTALPGASEEALLEALAARIRVLLAAGPDALAQALYRMDVPEAGARAALAGPQPVESLAALVLERARQKAAFRAANSRPAPPADDDLAW